MPTSQTMVSLVNDLASSKRTERYLAWQRLQEGALHEGCQKAVDQMDAEALDFCWIKFTQHGEKAIVEYCLAAYPNDNGGTDVDTDRLYRNACALLATAQAAVAARLAVSHPDAYVRLLEWAKEAATRLGGQSADGVAELHERWTDAEPIALVHYAYDALAQMGWQVSAAFYWTLHWLHDYREGSGHSLRVPVAGYHAGRGFLADLRLEHIGKGKFTAAYQNRLFEHPDIALRPFGRQFLDALNQAWQRTTHQSSLTTPQTVCWTLTVCDRGVSPTIPLDGDSLSGAAAVGFQLLCNGQLYDPTCLILARVDEGDRLKPVGCVREKLEAALRHGIKQAAVAEGTNLTGIVEEFRRRGLEVKRLRTLAELLEFASGLATGLGKYFELLATLPDREETLPAYMGGRKRTALYVEPLLVARVTREEGSTSQRVAPEAQDVYEDALYGEWMWETERVEWAKVCERMVRGEECRVAILGPPGQGKSLLAEMTARMLAQEGWENLTAQRVGVDGVPLPVVVQLNLLLQGGIRAGETPDAMLRRRLHAALRQMGCEEVAANYIAQHIHEERGWLFLDALDEVSDEAALATVWNALKDWHCHVIILSRPYGYAGRRLPFEVTEYRLAPFTHEQVKDFARKWWEEGAQIPLNRDKGHARMAHLLDHSPSVQQISQSPFLLTLLCWVLERHEVSDDITRTQLYDRMLLDILGLPPDGAGVVDEERAKRWLPVLADIAFVWFRDYDTGRRPIPYERLISLIADHPQRPLPLDDKTGQPMKISEVKNVTPYQQADYLLDELKRKRLLVPATEQPATYVVPHRSILEYLVALHLAKQDNWLTIAQSFIRNPAWHNVLPLLAGKLGKNAAILLDELTNFGERFKQGEEEFLEGMNTLTLSVTVVECLLECTPPLSIDMNHVWGTILRGIDMIQRRLRKNEWVTLADVAFLEKSLAAAERHALNSKADIARQVLDSNYRVEGERLQELLDSECPLVRWLAVWLVGKNNLVSWANLIATKLRERKEAPHVRALAARVLVRRKFRRQRPDLLPCVFDALEDECEEVAEGAAIALGCLATDDALKALLTKAQGEVIPIGLRIAITGALDRLIEHRRDDLQPEQRQELASVLEAALKKDDPRWAKLRSSAASALGKLGWMPAFGALWALLTNPNESSTVRSSACFAIALLCPDMDCSQQDAIKPTLRSIARNIEEPVGVRCPAISALGRFKDKEAVGELLHIAQQDDYEVVAYAALFAVTRFDDEDVIEQVVNRLPQFNNARIALLLKVFRDHPSIAGVKLCLRLASNKQFEEITRIQALSTVLFLVDKLPNQLVHQVVLCCQSLVETGSPKLSGLALRTFSEVVGMHPDCLTQQDVQAWVERCLRHLEDPTGAMHAAALGVLAAFARARLSGFVGNANFLHRAAQLGLSFLRSDAGAEKQASALVFVQTLSDLSDSNPLTSDDLATVAAFCKQMLEHPDERIRKTAGATLGTIGWVYDLAPLAALLNDESDTVRDVAQGAVTRLLGRIQNAIADGTSGTSLDFDARCELAMQCIDLINHRSHKVAASAMCVIQALVTKRLLPSDFIDPAAEAALSQVRLRKHCDALTTALATVRKLGFSRYLKRSENRAVALKYARQYLSHSDERVRAAAAGVLGVLGEHSDIQLLKLRLEGESSEIVQKSIGWALDRLVRNVVGQE